MPDFAVRPMDPGAARDISAWHYPAPYDIFDFEPGDRQGLLHPALCYWAVDGAGRAPAGFCCFGEDARVPGGDYASAGLLDVGYGLHPALLGQGLGRGFVAAVIRFAARAYDPDGYRVTIAAFNLRSQRVCTGLGFRQLGSFIANTGAAYMQMALFGKDTVPGRRP